MTAGEGEPEAWGKPEARGEAEGEVEEETERETVALDRILVQKALLKSRTSTE